MTDLSDFLKVKKVRCVSIGNYKFITVGKEYDVVGLTRNSVFIVNDDESENIYPYKHFKPVLDSAENPLQNIELTPEFEAVEPRFKVGDKVYYSTDKEIYTISEIDSENSGLAYLSQNDDDWDANAILKFCCHATQENYERLQATFPDIKFERPPLTGNELCRKLLDKGEKYIMARDDTDTWRIICDYCDDWFTDVVTGKCLKNVTPVNSKGEPLTESILNE